VASLVVFLRSGDWDARYLATSLAITGAALGDEVHVALQGEALRAFVEGRFGAGAPSTASGLHLPPLDATLSEARRELGLRVVACDTAARLAGLDPAHLVPPLDAVESLTTLWRLAQSGRVLSL
jgi:peroxiredoxin family protein